MSQSIWHIEFKASYNLKKISMRDSSKCIVVGALCRKPVKGNGDKLISRNINQMQWKQSALTDHRPHDTGTRPSLFYVLVVVVDSYGVTVELSCGDKLLDGLLDRSKQLPAVCPYKKIL